MSTVELPKAVCADSRSADLRFPLFDRAVQLGVLDGGSALIVAPTATGKSYIGREAVRRAIERRDKGTHAYLVPYRALAEEVFESFAEMLKGTHARVRISTGDHRDPIRPEDAELVVATYESFAAVLQRSAFQPGTIVADEIHLIADPGRGPGVEGLFARLLSRHRMGALCALSAVVENGAALAGWLGIPLLEGTVADRPVPLTLEHEMVDRPDEALCRILEPCTDGERAIVFCSSRGSAEKTARNLKDYIAPCIPSTDSCALKELTEQILERDPEAEDVVDLLPGAVAYHHAGLPRPIRRHIEQAFREKLIRVIASTPTLAAGVNLPADIVVVRDVFRGDTVRGTFRKVLLPSGEVLNMLGRAARPYQVEGGTGVALIPRDERKHAEIAELIAAVEAGRGGDVKSRLPESFEGIMRFVLASVVEAGEATREDVAAAYGRTFAHYCRRDPITFGRPFEQDMMEDIPSYQKVVAAKGAIRLEGYRLSPAGIQARVASRDKAYEVTLSLTGILCSCPAASQFYRGTICKHQACAVHGLLFGAGVPDEIRQRAIYVCGHVFSATLDSGTLLEQALGILEAWGLLERVAVGWKATPLGSVASGSGFDLLLVHQAAQRVRGADPCDYQVVAHWTVDDYIAEEGDQAKWHAALEKWLAEVDARTFKLPTKYRGDFERRLEDLSRVCLLYEKAAGAFGKKEIESAARAASGAVRYGVAPPLVPLMALGFAQLGRARSRYLYEQGVRSLQDLASADPVRIADPRRAPVALAREWVKRATEIHNARAVARADGEEADQEFDELVSRFRVDPAALA